MICKTCKENFPICEYEIFHNKKFYVAKNCSSCRKNNSIKTKNYRDKNKEQMRILYNSYRNANREKFKASRRRYMKEKCKDPLFKLRKNLRTRTWLVLRKGWKKGEWKEWLGCSFEDLKNHLESQFLPNMSWSNFGKWHIDHKIPLSSAKSKEELYSLCHYTNLQPLWALDNIKKANNK
jgi:hypothetical protein